MEEQKPTKSMPAQKPEAKPAVKPVEQEFQLLVRIANTDLIGHKKIAYALRKIKGVGFMFGAMACALTKVNPLKKTGDLTKDEINRLTTFIKDPLKHGAPAWTLNRRRSPETGEDHHIITADLNFTKENDLKRLKKIRSYRGFRHMSGLPCRGQRTKSNFRKSKSRGKGGLGVTRKKVGSKGGK